MDRIEKIVGAISFPGLQFETGIKDHQPWLRVRCASQDNRNPSEEMEWTGRKWRLSHHMTDGEIVQTAFLAVMTAQEHETREQFKFCGVSVFDPHYDIYKLVDLRRQSDAILGRAA